MLEVDVLPTQCQDFIASAPSQHQQSEARCRGGRDLAVRLEFVEHCAQPQELPLRQEALAASCGVLLDEPAGIAALRGVARFRGLVEQARQQPDNLVRRGRLLSQPIVQRRDLLRRDFAEALPPELRQEILVEDVPARSRGRRFAPHRHVLGHVLLRQFGDRRTARGTVLRAGSSRSLAVLHGRNDSAGLAPRGIQGPDSVAADGDAPRLPARPLVHHVDLRPRRMYAQPEAGNIMVQKLTASAKVRQGYTRLR